MHECVHVGVLVYGRVAIVYKKAHKKKTGKKPVFYIILVYREHGGASLSTTKAAKAYLTSSCFLVYVCICTSTI